MISNYFLGNSEGIVSVIDGSNNTIIETVNVGGHARVVYYENRVKI